MRVRVALALLLCCASARAHELGTIRVTARFQKGGAFAIDAVVDRREMKPMIARTLRVMMGLAPAAEKASAG